MSASDKVITLESLKIWAEALATQTGYVGISIFVYNEMKEEIQSLKAENRNLSVELERYKKGI